ncbi:hypothetical protein LTR94_024936 [Friedmanniomyces endolithicus]|nr:hypothetical protein LTR94_024936 [Friedmanniomyces endolithicus]
MKRRTLGTLTAVICLGGALTACAPTSRFEWGSYEQALYAYAQSPENRSVYKTSLEQAIERGKSRNAVAPGMYAELGYLFMEEGDSATAIANFEQERALFPESAGFMDRVIRQLGGQTIANSGQE